MIMTMTMVILVTIGHVSNDDEDNDGHISDDDDGNWSRN